ncbi:ArsR family transcriptional regulator [Fervidicella metallireducens AeB]|uniref:ArsR family transcriptional regulator n=1 Tax=Fervidicella metallireducens AeB TaxID=1403537 RepID=A0A017RW50_9CLOT|nr:ArsR family transcriptional regulator [Fervidicella metallireducens AeB]
MLDLVDILKAMSDENRIKIIKMLVCCDMCVCDICDNLELSQPAVSHHLKILSDANLVNTKRQGKWIYYSLNKEKFDELNQELLELIKKPAVCNYRKSTCNCQQYTVDFE